MDCWKIGMVVDRNCDRMWGMRSLWALSEAPVDVISRRLSWRKRRKEGTSCLDSLRVVRRILFLMDSMNVRWLRCMWLHIVKRSKGPSELYCWSIRLCSKVAKSGVIEFIRNKASKCELYISLPLVCRCTSEDWESHNSFAFSCTVSKRTWEYCCTRSICWWSWKRNVAVYHASFWRRIWIMFSVGISSSGDPLYFGCKPAHATCSKHALSKMSGAFGVTGAVSGVETAIFKGVHR